MELQQVGVMIRTGLALIALLVAVLVFVRSYRISALRQALFNVRDELFDYAAAGNISFEHPAYRILREKINGLIRFAHQATFVRFAVFAWMLRGTEPRGYAAWRKTVESVESADVQKALYDFNCRVAWAISRHIITGNPLVVIGIGLFAVSQGVADGLRRAIGDAGRRLITTRVSSLEEQIYDEDRRLMTNLRARVA